MSEIQNPDDMYLNEYHRHQSRRMVKYVSEQPLMSLAACIEQAKRLREQPDRPEPQPKKMR